MESLKQLFSTEVVFSTQFRLGTLTNKDFNSHFCLKLRGEPSPFPHRIAPFNRSVIVS